MSLLRLPPETLTEIFDLVGSSFFRRDMRRLTVCKQWFEFARPACFKSITLSEETLRILVSTELMKSPSLLQDSLRTLELKLQGYQVWISKHPPQQYAQGSNALKGASPDEALEINQIKTWSENLDDSLAQLAVVIQRSHKLHTLSIQAWNSPLPERLDNCDDSPSLATIQALLFVENLSVLVLDLSVNFRCSSGEREDGFHICPTIGSLLRTLRTLHIRMRSICPDVLKPHDPKDSLRLSVVAINLSLTADLPGVTAAAHSKRCGFLGGGLIQLKADLQKEGEALAARMTSPKTIRILTHSLPQFETQSLDVLTGKTMILDDAMAWDEDGKTVKEDSEPESDFSDDFSTFLDD